MVQLIKTTVVGSYPVPSWLVGTTSRLVLRDAVMAVTKAQELAGLDLITDGELMRFDPVIPKPTEWWIISLRSWMGSASISHFLKEIRFCTVELKNDAMSICAL